MLSFLSTNFLLLDLSIDIALEVVLSVFLTAFIFVVSITTLLIFLVFIRTFLYCTPFTVIGKESTIGHISTSSVVVLMNILMIQQE